MNHIDGKKFQYLNPDFSRVYFEDKTFVLSNDNDSQILKTILENGIFFIDGEKESMSDINVLQDAVNKQPQKKPGDKSKVGDDIFVLSYFEKKKINFSKNELELIKPYYITKELQRIFGNTSKAPHRYVVQVSDTTVMTTAASLFGKLKTG